MQDEGEDIAEMWLRRFERSPDRVEKRRQREARTISPVTARTGRRSETKTAQINVRVTPSFRKRLASLAVSRGVTIVELIEAAIDQLEGAGDGTA